MFVFGKHYLALRLIISEQNSNRKKLMQGTWRMRCYTDCVS